MKKNNINKAIKSNTWIIGENVIELNDDGTVSIIRGVLRTDKQVISFIGGVEVMNQTESTLTMLDSKGTITAKSVELQGEVDLCFTTSLPKSKIEEQDDKINLLAKEIDDIKLILSK